MSGSLNKVMIIGNLGADPEIRHMQDGRPVANLNIATNERWKDRDGNNQERTEWHRLVVFGGLADVVSKYMKKGDTAYFEGRIQTRKWNDNNGQERYTTEIVVDQGGAMQMLGKRSGGSDYSQDMSSSSSGGGYDQTPPAASKTPKVSDDAPFDDEIPF